jgi:predicted permease
VRDLREAVRALRSTPLVSSAAVLSLALAIGATTAIFSILNSLLLRPLPVRAPESLVAIGDASGQDAELDYPVWVAIRNRAVLDDAFAWAKDGVSEIRGAETLPVNVIWASGKFFETLGVPALRGRTLDVRDDRRGGGANGPAAVLSAAYWQRRYGGDPDVIGRTILLDRVPFTVVGVAAPGFFGLEVGTRFDVILPLETEPLLGRPSRLELWPWLHVTGRIPAGSSLATMSAALRTAQPDIRRETMPAFAHAADRDAYLSEPWTVHSAAMGNSRLRARYASALRILLLTAGLVLLVGCVNIANLQLARTSARRYDLSVRSALGASPWQVIRPVLLENVVIASAGATLGLLFAEWSGPLLVAQLATWASAPALDLPLDVRVLAATAVVTVAAALLFGTAPVLLARRASPVEILNRVRTGGGRRVFELRDGLVVLQIASCIVLVFGAHVFVRSFASLVQRDLGFDRRPVVVAVVDASRSRVAASGRLALYERLRDRAAAIAGAEHAALSLATPLGSAGVRMTREVSLDPADIGHDAAPRVLTTLVSPAWFATYGTRIVSGRDFTTADRAGGDPVAIVNEAFVRRFFGGANPLAQIVAMGHAGSGGPEMVRIVGVVADAAFTSVRAAVEPSVYRPFAQAADERLLQTTAISISVRAAPGVAPGRLHGPLAESVTAVDRDLSVAPIDVKTQLDAYYVRERLLGLVSGFFAVLALLLGALGLYGVSAHAVTRRRREIGVRMALGADRRRILGLVFSRVIAAWTLGALLGALGSAWLARGIEGLLYGVGGRDPLALAAAAVMLFVTAIAATWMPARRAARTEPIIVLREQ